MMFCKLPETWLALDASFDVVVDAIIVFISDLCLISTLRATIFARTCQAFIILALPTLRLVLSTFTFISPLKCD